MATMSIWDDFTERTSDRNLGLQVEDEIFWVSREELTKQSPIFDRMLNGEFKESQQDVVKLGEKTAKEILELLRVIFLTEPDRSMVITGENVENLMKLGDEYEIPVVMGKCSDFLMSEIIDGDDIDQRMNYLMMAVQHKLREVVRSALRPLAYLELPHLIPYFDRLPLEILCAISLMRAAAVGPFEHDLVGMEPNWHCGNCGRDSGHCPFANRCFIRAKRCKYCAYTICGICGNKYPYRLHNWNDTRCYSCHNCGEDLMFENGMAICECVESLAIDQLKKVDL